MVCSQVIRQSSLCCSGFPAQPLPALRTLNLTGTSPSGSNAFLGALTWQIGNRIRGLSGAGTRTTDPAMQHERVLVGGCRQPIVRAESGAGAAEAPAEGPSTVPLQAVASPASAAPVAEAGRNRGKRGRGGSRSKEKRRLVLLRHAKSSFADPSVRDHERPLDEAGRVSAREVAAKLKSSGWLPKLVLCSDSLRTRETLAVMQSVVAELAEAETRFLGSYYTKSQLDGQTAAHLRETICNYAADAFVTVMCMGHNRGWEEAASDFTGMQLELKTANAALLETTGDSWEDAFEHAYKGGWNLCGLLTPDPAG